jgi:hypothetical protein
MSSRYQSRESDRPRRLQKIVPDLMSNPGITCEYFSNRNRNSLPSNSVF